MFGLPFGGGKGTEEAVHDANRPYETSTSEEVARLLRDDDALGAPTETEAPPADAELSEAETVAEPAEEVVDFTLAPPAEVVEHEPPEPTIALIDNEHVQKFIRQFQGSERGFFERSVERARAHLSMIQRVLGEHDLPREIAALALIESGYNTRARSRAGAAGMWQFMPRTGKHYGLDRDYWMDERNDPAKSTIAAAEHLKSLHEYYKEWPLALAAYNAGMGKVNRAVRRAHSTDFWKIREHRWLLRRETKNYVPRFYAAVHILREPERYGFQPLIPTKERRYDYAEVPDATDLKVIADSADVSHKEVNDLNPELRRWCTPPGKYKVRLPAGTGAPFEVAFARIPDKERISFRLHKVRSGETPSHIARRYGVSSRVLMSFNGIRSARSLRAGKTIIVPVRGDGGPIVHPLSPVQMVSADDRHRAVPSSGVYVVRRGDSLWKISRRYDVAMADLRKLNSFGKDPLLRPGDRVVLAKTSGTTANGRKTVAGKTHTVRNGDSLWKISRRYDVGMNTLRRLNGFGKNPTLRPGDRVVVGNASASVATGGTYDVRSGDSLWSIARRYGTTSSGLAVCNGFSTRHVLHPGDVIRLCNRSERAVPAGGVHVVARGESLWEIARAYSIPMRRLFEWNELNSRSVIRPGDRIRLTSATGL